MRPLLILFFIVLAAAPAGAQTNPIDQVRESYRSHAGPFYVNPGLILRDLGMDSNVFNQPAEPKSDFTFTLSPRADVAVPVAHRALFKVGVGVDLVYYQKYSSERSANPRFAPRAEVYLNKLSFFGEGSYLRSRQRPNYEIDARSLRTERWLGGGVGYQYSPKLALELSARRADLEYDPEEIYLNVPLYETLNRDSRMYAGVVRYALTPLTTLVLKGDTSQDRFPHSPVRDADTTRIMPGVEFGARALITGSAYVGVRQFRTKSDAVEDFDGLVASAALGYTLLGRTAFVVTADRDVTYSFERFQPYYVINSVAFTVRHRLAGKFDLTGGVGRHEYAYRDLVDIDAADSAIPESRVDLTRNVSLSVGYTLGPDVRIGFGTTYWWRESNSIRFRDYEAFRTGVSLNYGF